MAGYSYATPSDDGATGRALANATASEVLTQTAGTPFLGWKDSPVRGHVLLQLVGTALCPNIDGMTGTLSGPETRTLCVDGGGWVGAVDLPPGIYTFSMASVQLPVTVTAGQVTKRTILLPGCAPYGAHLPVILK
jgi:hypothetical protein